MVQSNGNGNENGNRDVNLDDIDVYELIAPEEWFKYNLGTSGEREIVFDEQLPEEFGEDDEESDNN